MKIKTGKKTKSIHLFVAVILILALLTGLFHFIDRTQRTEEQQLSIDCVEYVRRGCCEQPDSGRCEEGAVGWDHDKSPYNVCCE